jgi:hypothetical protein
VRLLDRSHYSSPIALAAARAVQQRVVFSKTLGSFTDEELEVVLPAIKDTIINFSHLSLAEMRECGLWRSGSLCSPFVCLGGRAGYKEWQAVEHTIAFRSGTSLNGAQLRSERARNSAFFCNLNRAANSAFVDYSATERLRSQAYYPGTFDAQGSPAPAAAAGAAAPKPANVGSPDEADVGGGEDGDVSDGDAAADVAAAVAAAAAAGAAAPTPLRPLPPVRDQTPTHEHVRSVAQQYMAYNRLFALRVIEHLEQYRLAPLRCSTEPEVERVRREAAAAAQACAADFVNVVQFCDLFHGENSGCVHSIIDF